jgi:hypothetical protein
VPFFHLKIPVRISGGGQDTTFIFYPDSSGQEYLISLPFEPTSLVFDPQKWLLAKATVQVISANKQLRKQASPLKINPNPFYDSLEFFAASDQVNIILFDSSGKEVFRKYLDRAGVYKISMNHLIPGNYLLFWDQGERSGVHRLLKSVN